MLLLLALVLCAGSVVVAVQRRSFVPVVIGFGIAILLLLAAWLIDRAAAAEQAGIPAAILLDPGNRDRGG